MVLCYTVGKVRGFNKMYEERNDFNPNANPNYHLNNNEMNWNNYPGQGYYYQVMMEAERKANEKEKRKKVITTILAIIGGFQLLSFIIGITLTSFTSSETDLTEEPAKKETFTATGYDFVVNADEGWEDILGLYGSDDDFDMELYNGDMDIVLMVQAYNKTELGEDVTAKNFKELYTVSEEEDNSLHEIAPNRFFYEDDNKMIYSYIFTWDDDETYYYCYTIDRKESDELLWVMAGGDPDDLMEHREEFEDIVEGIE